MPAIFSCDLNTLLTESACLREFCTPEEQRKAIDIYLRVQNLAAIGGTDYRNNLLALRQAAALWESLACNQRKAIDLFIDMQNALDNGASFSQNINALHTASQCYQCIGHEAKEGILSFLKCAINTLGKPD